MPIRSQLRDLEILRTLEPEALAGYVLQDLNSRHGEISYWNYWLQFRQEYQECGENELKEIFSSAWTYLMAEGLLALSPSANGEYFLVTRRGSKLRNSSDIRELAKRSLLKKSLLHPVLQGTVYAQFLSGNYDLSVIEAYKRVEIAVRDGSQIKDGYGSHLMRDAFKPAGGKGQPGPLADASLDVAEQEALSNLFAGAMGWCRNPVHHRDVHFSTDETIQLLSFATYLLTIVDYRVDTLKS